MNNKALMAFENVWVDINAKYVQYQHKYKYVQWVLFKYIASSRVFSWNSTIFLADTRGHCRDILMQNFIARFCYYIFYCEHCSKPVTGEK